jgi:FkbM family methyltransferase
VEVGCFNGVDCGVITPLADLGWKGLCIDASSFQAAACSLNHSKNPKVITVCVAVGAHDGVVSLYGHGAGATVNEEYRNVMTDISWVGSMEKVGEVPQTTLTKLLNEYNFQPGFELLSVDVEGHEPEVFDGFDLAYWHPKVMVIEMTDNHPDFANKSVLNERYQALRQKILNEGYKEVHRDIINTVYVFS